ncbi:MAG: zinc ribbon domain-containing protein [bacterium]
MPLYDYNCSKCGKKPDIWAKIDEMDLFCPDCGNVMHRLISASNIICDIKPYFDENLADPKKSTLLSSTFMAYYTNI